MNFTEQLSKIMEKELAENSEAIGMFLVHPHEKADLVNRYTTKRSDDPAAKLEIRRIDKERLGRALKNKFAVAGKKA